MIKPVACRAFADGCDSGDGAASCDKCLGRGWRWSDGRPATTCPAGGLACGRSGSTCPGCKRPVTEIPSADDIAREKALTA